MGSNTEFEFSGINHLALVSSDMARTVEFYSGVLGWTELAKPPLLAARATARGATRMAWMAVLLLVGAIVAIAALVVSGDARLRA